MTAVWLAAAWLIALTHLTVIVLLVAGGPITVRHPRFARVHVPVVLAVGAVFLLGMDCPLTVWQKACLERAGRGGYEGGFIEHYIVRPITGGGVTLVAELVIVVTGWCLPLVSYALVVISPRGRGWPRARAIAKS